MIGLISFPSLLSNILGSHLFEKDVFTGIEYTTVANSDGLNSGVRFEWDAQTELVNSRYSRDSAFIPDLLYSLFFIGYILFIRFMTNKDVEEVTKGFSTIGDYAVVLKGLPTEYKNIEQEITDLMEKHFGSVVEVIIGREYKEALYFHVKLNEVRVELEYAKYRQENGCNNHKQIKSLEAKERQLEIEVGKQMDSLNANALPITLAYVVFNEVKDKLSCLDHYKKGQLTGEYKLG